MLAGEWGRAEFPVDLPTPALDHHDGRDVAEAKHNIPIGQFADPIGEGPSVTVVLDGRYAVLRGIEMLPALPLPHDFPVRSHFHEVIADHLAALRLGPGTT